MPVFEYSLRLPGGRQQWHQVRANTFLEACHEAHKDERDFGATLYAGPLLKRCRYCRNLAITLVGKPGPWAAVCEAYRLSFPGR